MTRQQMFNTAYHGLAAQGFMNSAKGIGPLNQTVCAYRGADGRRCAIGYLISDEIAGDWEGSGIIALPDSKITRAGFNPKDKFFLMELQLAHDESMGPADMLDRVKRLAVKYGLTIPSLPISAEAPAAKEIEHAESEWRDFAPAE